MANKTRRFSSVLRKDWNFFSEACWSAEFAEDALQLPCGFSHNVEILLDPRRVGGMIVWFIRRSCPCAAACSSPGAFAVAKKLFSFLPYEESLCIFSLDDLVHDTTARSSSSSRPSSASSPPTCRAFLHAERLEQHAVDWRRRWM